MDGQAGTAADLAPGAWRVLDRRLSVGAGDRIALALAAAFALYATLALAFTLQGRQTYAFGDFHALWTSGVLAQGGEPAINYDADALHARQIALGINPRAENPFPYPPIMLLWLAPLGALPLRAAFYAFMLPSFAAYLAAMAAGRARAWPWALAACVAPASAMTLISGQSGFLSAALAVGGLRLLPLRPALAGVLFGLLAYKPQLGLLLPVALVAMGAWRALAAATATALATALLSGLLFGFDLWPLWLHALADYARRFPPVLGYMPTIEANAAMLGASPALARGLQIVVSLVVAATVWRAWRGGPTPRAVGLVLVGGFLATPHAFNYDMPMTTAALVGCWWERRERGLEVGEALALGLAALTPFVMKELQPLGVPFSFAPLGLMFAILAGGPSVSRSDALGE